MFRCLESHQKTSITTAFQGGKYSDFYGVKNVILAILYMRVSVRIYYRKTEYNFGTITLRK